MGEFACLLGVRFANFLAQIVSTQDEQPAVFLFRFKKSLDPVR